MGSPPETVSPWPSPLRSCVGAGKAAAAVDSAAAHRTPARGGAVERRSSNAADGDDVRLDAAPASLRGVNAEAKRGFPVYIGASGGGSSGGGRGSSELGRLSGDGAPPDDDEPPGSWVPPNRRSTW